METPNQFLRSVLAAGRLMANVGLGIFLALIIITLFKTFGYTTSISMAMASTTGIVLIVLGVVLDSYNYNP